MEWFDRKSRLPDHTRPVWVVVEVGVVRNPKHPGYPDGRWVWVSHRARARDSDALLDAFQIELFDTGVVTHWAEAAWPALPERIATH